jgi:hypothetical protein
MVRYVTLHVRAVLVFHTICAWLALDLFCMEAWPYRSADLSFAMMESCVCSVLVARTLLLNELYTAVAGLGSDRLE